MKGGKIKNKYYNSFLSGEFIQTITPNTIRQVIDNIKHDHALEGRCLLILLYYTGARPIEILSLKGEDIQKTDAFLQLHVKTFKHGRNRTILLPLKESLIKLAWKHISTIYPSIYLFRNYRSQYSRVYQTKKGPIFYHDVSNKLRHYFNKWFDGIMDDPIPPYYLRHNLFSIMSEKGASLRDMQDIKGSKSESSIMPYLHMSTNTARKNIKFLPKE